jgi:hypothetical protein
MEHFNAIAGLVLAQLYERFPLETEIDEAAIADAMGVEKTDAGIQGHYRQAYGDYAGPHYNYGQLPSGDPFLAVLWSTLTWLRSEGFIRAEGHKLHRTSSSQQRHWLP